MISDINLQRAGFGFMRVKYSDGTIMDANNTLITMLNYPQRTDIVNESMDNILAEPHRNYTWLKAQLILAEGMENIQTRLREKDGMKRRVALDVWRDEEDESLEIIVYDQSKLNAVEEELRTAEKHKRYLKELVKEAYFVEQTDKIIDVNNQFKELFKLDKTRQALTGLSMVDFVSENNKRKYSEFIDLLYLSPEKAEQIIFKAVDSAGIIFEVQGNFIVLYNGDIPLLYGLLSDDTKVLTLEKKLLQSQKLEAIGKLASGIAHDFNNLLTAIMGHTELAIVGLELNKFPKNDLELVQNAAEKASVLTRQLLAFVRQQKVEPKIVNPNNLIMNMDKMLRRIIGEDVNLSTVLCEDIQRIKVDPGQFEQIIVNLAVNARDAMPKGGDLVISTDNLIVRSMTSDDLITLEPGSFVKISVEDKGTGIPENILKMVFDPFFTTKAEGKGTGLGLSTVKDIVVQNYGQITVESTENIGTVFQIYFPMIQGDADDLSFKTVKDKLPRGDESLLIVEDELSVLEFTVKMLKRLGYKVTEAHDGGEAIEICNNREHHFDLIITDLIMPDMNGVEMLKQINMDTKILYMSGYQPDSFIKDIFSHDTNYLQKPFNPLTLAKKVREVLEQ